MLTYMGFEAYDPTNMYQYSYAYDFGNTVETQSIRSYDVGVSVDYVTDAYGIGVWSSAENSAGYELALAYTGLKTSLQSNLVRFFRSSWIPAYEKNLLG